MARFRKVDQRMYADAKYRRLSPCPPSGRALWWHLIAGPQTGIIPGLFSIGEAAFAELLEWPLKAFREAFAEVSQQGMAEADWKARVVWIPRAIVYNPPSSPNVIKSWREPWRTEIGECDLKAKAWDRLRVAVEGFGDAFAKAFHQALPEGVPKALPEPFADAFGESGEERIEQEKRAGEDPPSPQPALPFASEAFAAAWRDFEQHRREIRKPLTPTATRQAIAKLASWGEAKAIEALQNSVANGWIGVFEPDAKRGKKSLRDEIISNGQAFIDETGGAPQ